MVERNVIKITHKIFRPDDIQRLCRILEDEFDKLAQRTMHDNSDLTEEQSLGVYRKVSIALTDGRTYSGHPKELSGNNEGPLFSEPVKKIFLSYADRNQDAELVCSLADSHDIASEISIESDDQLWTNGMKGRLEAYLSTVENQPAWPRRYAYLQLMILALPLTYFAFYLMELLVLQLGLDKPINLAQKAFLMVIAMFTLGLPLAGVFLNRIQRFWPVVELQTGKEFMHVAKRKRNRAWFIIGLLIAGFVGAIISWLFFGG